jgi:hypothetical protein
MNARKLVATLMLGSAAVLAYADRDRDCSNIDDSDKRRECREMKNDVVDEVDCGDLDNDEARRECRQEKYGVASRAACRTLQSAVLRTACLAERWD